MNFIQIAVDYHDRSTFTNVGFYNAFRHCGDMINMIIMIL